MGVHLQARDIPVGIGEGTWVVLDKSVASCSLRGTRTGGPHIASPVTTEGRVEDDLLVVEIAVNVAATLEHGYWFAPARRIRVARGDVRGDGRAGEEPDRDCFGGPLGRVDSSICVVEAGAVSEGVLSADAAACIVGLTGSIDIAVRSVDGATELIVVGNATTTGSVKGHGVGGGCVDALCEMVSECFLSCSKR